MPDNLFSEFSPSDKESWKKQADKELKGKLLNPQNWKIADTVYIEPYYTSAEIDRAQTKDIQDAQKVVPGWLNTTLVHFDAPLKTNLTIRTALDSGADAILLDLQEREIPACEFTKTLHAVKLSDTFIYFQTSKDPELLFRDISRGAGYNIKGGIANDLMAHWMLAQDDPEPALNQASRTLQLTKTMKDFRPYMVGNHIYHNAGANPVQELAFMLSSLVACVDYFTDHGISPLHALNRFFFSVSIGPEYLTEIAKLRALRFLYRKITRAYALPDALCHAFIHAQTSAFYHSDIAVDNNMLRRTSEAMSAVSSGCDALTVADFTKVNEGNLNRIAQNTSLLLAHESGMNKVADAGAGSFLIEEITSVLAESAWKLFLETEKMGGLMKSYQSGFIQSEIEKSWHEKFESVSGGKVILGVSKYADSVQREFSNFKKTAEDVIKTDFPLLQSRKLEDAWMANQQ